MKEIFSEINTIDSVKASFFFAEDGTLIVYEAGDYSDLTREMVEDFSSSLNWKAISKKFSDINETELLFSKFRVYMRKAENGFVVVLMGLMAPIEVVRLNIDLIMPDLDSLKKSKKIGRFFKFRS
jgi:roadblock/LC7 domain-containing protein